MKRAFVILAGFVLAVLATVAMVLAVSFAIGGGQVLDFFSTDSALVAVLMLAGSVAMVAAPGWVLGRGVMAVFRLRELSAYAVAGAVAAAVGVTFLPGNAFSFGLIGMGAVAGVVAGLIERRLGA